MSDNAPSVAGERRIELVLLDDLTPATRNPKRHSPDIGRSIDRFGFVEPMILDERTGRLVAGHGRLDALAQARDRGDPPPEGVEVDEAGAWRAPVLRGWSSTSDTEAEAYLVASNRLTEHGGWDDSALAELLAELATTDIGLDGTGYTDDSLTELLASLEDPTPPEPVAPDDTPQPRQVAARVQRGHVWLLGRHRLMCGDVRDARDMKTLVGSLPGGGRFINLAVTSPPYAEQREYDDESGFKPIAPADYVDWFDAVQANVAAHLAADGSWLVNIKPSADTLDTDLYVIDLVAAHVRRWGWHFATEFCWERPGVPKSPTLRLKNAFEPIYQFTRGRWKFRPDNVRHISSAAIEPLGPGAGDTSWGDQAGKDRQSNASRQGGVGDEWFGHRHVDGLAYPSNRLPTFAGTHEATGHPAAYPVGLPEFMIRLFTDNDDVILDPFCGSGSTILAAHRAGRVALGMELSARYCDTIIDRWERHTNIEAVLAPED